MMTVRALLPKYHQILEEQGMAQYLDCKHIPVSFERTQSTDDLWHTHDEALQLIKVQNILPKPSLLDLKIELADRLFHSCCFCEHRCKVNRKESIGKCGVKESRIASEFLHFGEEHVLVPSYTIFFLRMYLQLCVLPELGYQPVSLWNDYRTSTTCHRY